MRVGLTLLSAADMMMRIHCAVYGHDNFVFYSTRRLVVCLSVFHFVFVFFSPFSIAITSLGEERANLSAFRTFVQFVLV